MWEIERPQGRRTTHGRSWGVSNRVQKSIQELAASVSNWGRWGPADQIGTLNTIGAAKLLEACACVAEGRVVPLAIELGSSGPETGRGERFNPIHWMIATGTDAVATGGPNGFGYADDAVTMPLQAGTQWDGLAHVFHEGRMWNGRPATLVTSGGAAENGIQHAAGRIATRGVMLDVARHLGVESLPDGTVIGADLLDDVADAAGVTIGPGDALLVRTGHIARFVTFGDWTGFAEHPSPGLGLSALQWLRERDVAAVASDTYRVEVFPPEIPTLRLPFHIVAIVYMGLLLGEIFDLEALADRCATSRRYAFLFVAPALPIVGAVGSPTNPYAIL
jgi:kynurenine formamidase